MEVQPVGTPANQSFPTGVVPIVVGVLNPANNPSGIWDCGTAYEYASITTVVAGTPTSFTILLEGSLDGATWFTLATTTNTAGETQFSTGAVPFGVLRARCTAVVGGSSPTVSVVAVAYQNPPETIPGGTTPGGGVVSGTVTANQGTAAAVAGAWPVEVTNGTSVAAVKAASTAVVATDPALVVAVSPNAATLMGLLNGASGVSGNQATVALNTQETSPASANILTGNATADGGTIITIPQNKIWVGVVTLSAAVVVAAGASAAINALPNVTTTGASAVPAANSVVCGLAISVGANVAGALSAGSANDAIAIPVTVYAGATASATLKLNFNSATAASAVAVGYLR